MTFKVATLAEICERTARELAYSKRYGHSVDMTHLEFDVLVQEIRRLQRYEEIADYFPDEWDELRDRWQADNGPLGVGA